MRACLQTPALLALLLVIAASARADKQAYERSQDEVESALDLDVSLRTPARIRPSAPVQVTARLVNRSGKRALKVIRPGNGCGMGIVEPYLRYTARYRPPAEGPWRDVAVRPTQGMCGMGDYRWHHRVTELAPGASLDFTNRLSAASVFVDFSKPGHYEVRLHYAFRRRGTTEKLPQADPVGALGPMRRMPAFDIASEPVRVTVVRPIEIVAEPLGRPAKGVARRLSDLLRVRVENWTGKPLTLHAGRIKLLVRLRGAQAARIRRKPLTIPPGFTKRTLAPGASTVLVGPKGIYDEAWVADADGQAEVHAVVGGLQPGGSRVRSAWVRLR